MINTNKEGWLVPEFVRFVRVRSLIISLACLFLRGLIQAQSGNWTTPIRINTDTFFTVTYPAMAISREGKIFVVWQHFSTRPYNIAARLFFCSFDGQSWSPEVAITDTNATDWTPEIAVDTLGFPHVVWGSYSAREIYHQWYDGLKWSIPENVSEDSGDSFFPSTAIDKKNNIHVAWHDNTGGGFAVYYRRFDGSSWSPTSNVSDTLINAGDPRIGVDSKDNVHVAFDCYISSPGNNYDIFYRSLQAGIWSSLARLTSDSLESAYPDIAVNTNNLPIVVWEQVVDITVSPIIVRVYASTFDGSSWTVPSSIADTSQSYEPRIAVDKSGRVHMVWQVNDHFLRTSQIMYSSSRGGPWSVPLSISGSISGPSKARIKTDSAGLCHVIFVGADNGIYYTRQTGVDGVTPTKWQTPGAFVLEQNYPNPFNPRTIIEYTLPQRSRVFFKVFDIAGREVSHWFLGDQPPGEHSLVFDASGLSSGTYFFQIQIDGHTLTKKMILLR